MGAPQRARLFDRPWLLAPACALGVTLLVPGAVALFAPPELLDRVWMLGDRVLSAALVALFVAALGVAWLLLGGSAGEGELPSFAEPSGNQPPPPATTSHL